MKHPAKFSEIVLVEIIGIIRPERERRGGPLRILDPFAGVGGVHALAAPHHGHDTVGVELEPEWAACHPRTRVGDATALEFEDESFDAIVTSPCYGNRMADHHEAKDDSRRHTYRHALGRELSENSAGRLQWGVAYRALHGRAWAEALRVLRPDGLMVVNISNHIRDGIERRVAEWHAMTLLSMGLRLWETRRVATPRNRHGANGDKRVEGELILVLRK